MKQRTRTAATLFTLLLIATILRPGVAQHQPRPEKDYSDRTGKLSLHTGTIETRSLGNLLHDEDAVFDASRRYVLQLDGPITPTRRQALAARGVVLGDYIPHFAYVARLGATTTAALRTLDFVDFVGDYLDDWKISTEFGSGELDDASRQQLAAAGLVTAHVTFFRGVTRDDAGAMLRSIDRATLHAMSDVSGHVVAAVTLPASTVPELADRHAIQFVEEAPEITLRNESVRGTIQSDHPYNLPFYWAGIRGEQQIIGLIDSEVDPFHCSFDDSEPIGPTHRKIHAYNTALNWDWHGTHVAGTALGDAGDDTDTRGVAYKSRLVYNDVPTYTEIDVYDRFLLHHSQGARVHTNAWGDDSTTDYNGLCRAIDAFMWDYENSLIINAASNTPVLTNPENAKNLIAVGATQDYPGQDYHCYGGSGPTADYRRKPELFAPGCAITSARDGTGCDTRTIDGTSVASAAVAGTAALVRQYYNDGFYPTGVPTTLDALEPSAALVKATLLNSTVDMTTVPGFPSDTEGWGRLIAGDGVYFPGDTNRLVVLDDAWRAEGLTTYDVREYHVQVVTANEMLKVTLAWTDAPASAATGQGVAAVNDLDLSVWAPDGTQYIGNVFQGGVSVPGGWWDYDNNVEKVHIALPTPGIWTVRVTAPAVNFDQQGFAVVATGDINPFDAVIETCGRGAVTAGCGFRQDVLTVNGLAGGVDRTILVDPVTPLSFELTEPFAEAGDGYDSAACVYMWFTRPIGGDTVRLPKQLGFMCFGPYFRTTLQPDWIWNSLGYHNKLGQHTAPAAPPIIPDGGTVIFYDMPGGMGAVPIDVTLQGIIPDFCSQGAVPFSATNAVLIEVR